jgi:hypothetical protein
VRRSFDVPAPDHTLQVDQRRVLRIGEVEDHERPSHRGARAGLERQDADAHPIPFVDRSQVRDLCLHDRWRAYLHVEGAGGHYHFQPAGARAFEEGPLAVPTEFDALVDVGGRELLNGLDHRSGVLRGLEQPGHQFGFVGG